MHVYTATDTTTATATTVVTWFTEVGCRAGQAHAQCRRVVAHPMYFGRAQHALVVITNHLTGRHVSDQL